jgi:hypothetical protein
MSPIPVNLAVEDELSEAIMRQLLHFSEREYCIGTAYGRTGFGYLRRTSRGFNQAAKGTPFVLLTDLDEGPCPSALIAEWLGGVALNSNFLFLVAFREVEAWLLADADHLAKFLTIKSNLIPTACENISDPKQTLVNLARKARSAAIRERIVPRSRSTAQQGPDYNACLITFVTGHWDIRAACDASTSLRRTVERLRAFEPTWA